MLEEILVENLLIIDSARAGLDPGLNVISGETGVGKSLLLSAIELIFGGRLDPDAGRENGMRVEGRFRIRSEDREYFPEDLLGDDDELVIRVMRRPGGAQRCYLNGSIVSRRELQELGGRLVDVHGQRDMQRLLGQREQVMVLDRYAGTTDLAREFADLFHRFEQARDKVARRIEVERELQDRLGVLHIQCAELETADPQPGEHAELTATYRILEHRQQAVAALTSGCDALTDDEHGVVGRLGRVGGELSRIGEEDAELGALSERAFALSASAEELAHDLRQLGEARARLDADPEAIRERLNLLNDLMGKYRTDEPGLIERSGRLRTEIGDLEGELEELRGLDDQLEELAEQLRELGGRLATHRGRAGRRLSKLVEAELEELRMPHARFRVEPGGTEPDEAVSSLGFGRPRFLIRTNPGGPFADLEAAASGGELSRLLLALKSVLADTHRMPLLIFDEIETGVGPRLGVMLGRRLRRLAGHRQVLCITHLPQIAAFAQRHLKIDKIVRKSKTHAHIERLDGDQRLDELAAMLGGGDPRLAKRQAKSLLAEAQAFERTLGAGCGTEAAMEDRD